MTVSRREFLVGSTVAAAFGHVRLDHRGRTPSTGSEPWLEIDAAAITHNVRTIARLTGGKPIIAVAKNNAYGCGCAVAGPILDGLPEVSAIAVVRIEEAITLRQAGVRKPVLLMARCEPNEMEALVEHDIRLTPDETSVTELVRLARKGRQVAVHLYVDAGMHRMGVPVDRVAGIAEALRDTSARIEGLFTELTEEVEFDKQIASQVRGLANALGGRGLRVGMVHAASSHAVWHIPEAFLDAVRPGIAVYGGYASAEAWARGELKAAYRLRAPVAKVTRLQAGEGVSYHLRWIAAEPTWVATLPVGHVDGYPSGAVKGCAVLIGERLCPVIGTVSASHTIVSLGAESSVKVGDVATLVGPDHPIIHPNEVAKRAGWSEYNMFMHLNPLLKRIQV